MNERIAAYDVARALAMFAMVVVNFKTVMVDDPLASRWLVDVCHALDGRAAAVFVVLAGVGTSLISAKARLSGDPARVATARQMLRRRALVLFLFGLVFSVVWPADILHFYGAYLLAASYLVAVETRRLWQVACFFIFGFVVLAIAFDYERGWDFNTLEYVDFWTARGFARHLVFNGFHPVFPWFALYVLGMWLGRQDVRNTGRRRVLLGRAVIVVVLVEAGAAWMQELQLKHVAILDADVLPLLLGTAPLPPTPAYILAAGGTALIVILLCVELCALGGWAAQLRALASIGRCSLSLYVAHVVLVILPLLAAGRLTDHTLVFALILAAGVLPRRVGIHSVVDPSFFTRADGAIVSALFMTTMTHPKILLVEDDERLASLVRDYLVARGFLVGIEGRGDRALARVLSEMPDVVILDIGLPGLDGLSVCRALRQDYEGTIIMLTARGEDPDEIVGLECGADDYLRKPVHPGLTCGEAQRTFAANDITRRAQHDSGGVTPCESARTRGSCR